MKQAKRAIFNIVLYSLLWIPDKRQMLQRQLLLLPSTPLAAIAQSLTAALHLDIVPAVHQLQRRHSMFSIWAVKKGIREGEQCWIKWNYFHFVCVSLVTLYSHENVDSGTIMPMHLNHPAYMMSFMDESFLQSDIFLN